MYLSPSNLLSVFLNILQPVETSLSLDRTIQECAADVVDALGNSFAGARYSDSSFSRVGQHLGGDDDRGASYFADLFDFRSAFAD